jgi:hypothetical protein
VEVAADKRMKSDDDFTVFLLLFAIFMVSIMIGIAAAGFLIMIMLFGVFVILLSIGIISISLWAAYSRRSATAGYKAFIYLSFSLVGIALGLAGSFFGAKIISLDLPDPALLIGGGIAGGLGGFLLAYIISKLTVIARHYMQSRFIQTGQDNR